MAKNRPFKLKHPFSKLYGQRKGTLMGVEMIRTDQLTNKVREYETKYVNPLVPADPPKYAELPGGTLLRLHLVGSEGIPFTHLVKYKSSTAKKYEDILKSEDESKLYFFEVEEDKGE